MWCSTIRTLALLTSFWGAKWGAIFSRRGATQGLPERSIIMLYLMLRHSETRRATVGSSMAWRGSGVRIPSAPPSSEAGSDLGTGRF